MDIAKTDNDSAPAFDRVIGLDECRPAYRAMNGREATKVMVVP